MKRLIFFIYLFFYFTQSLVAQTQLEKGDIVVLGVNSSNVCGRTTEEFIYLLFLKDVQPNTVMYITDNRYNGSSLLTNEGTLKLTKTNTVLPKGSIVKITINNSIGTGSLVGWNVSKVTTSSNNPLTISNTGDQIFIVNNASTTPIFLGGFNTKMNWITPPNDGSNSELPANLIDLHQSNSENVNNRYRHYIGDLSANLSKGEWIIKILNSNNWKNNLTNNTSCNIFNQYTANNFDNKRIYINENTSNQEVCDGDFIEPLKVISESNIVNYKWYRSDDNIISINNDVLVEQGSNHNEYTPNMVGNYYYYCVMYIDLPLNGASNTSISYTSNTFKIKINPLPKISPIEIN